MKGIKINKTLRNFLIAVAAIVAVFVITSLIPDKDFHEKYEGFETIAVPATKPIPIAWDLALRYNMNLVVFISIFELSLLFEL